MELSHDVCCDQVMKVKLHVTNVPAADDEYDIPD